MKEAKKLWSWLAIPCIALAVLTGSILPVLLVREFYTVQIGPLGICEASGLTRRQAAEAYGDVMDYCMGRRPDFSTGVLPFSAERSTASSACTSASYCPVSFLPFSIAFPPSFFTYG